MNNTQRVAITPDNNEPTLEQSAEQLKVNGLDVKTLQDENSGTQIKISEPSTDTQTSEQEVRPEWLPEKFKNAEDLAKAYSELEKKLSIPKDDKPEPNIQDARKFAEEQNNLEKFYSEYSEKGELSEKSYTELAKQGLTRELVDGYIAGQKAIGDQHAQQVHSVVGGKEQYDNLIQWASENLSSEEQDAFNTTVDTGTVEQVKFAVRGLMSQAGMSSGQTKSEMLQGETFIDNDTFTSLAQVTEAMNDPRYDRDPSYRRKIEEKLSKSSVI